MRPRLEAVDVERSCEVASVLADAFRSYPVFQHVIGPGHTDYDRRLRALIDHFVFARTRHTPALGMWLDGAIEAVALITLPSEPPPEQAVIDHWNHLWRDLGEDARERYEDYLTATAAFEMIRPHHHLNMVGVCRRSAGRGLARPMLDAVARMSREHGTSAGVSLTTELPRIVRFYEHFGYRVQRHVRVTSALESWSMFLETRP